MTNKKPMGSEHTQRDAETLWALGLFLVVLSLPVFVGTLYADAFMPGLVNFLAASAIFIIGALMIWRGRWTKKHLD